ncbi:type II secretion system F family protein [Clostridium sp. WILCCON 0202]|uniref:Type II secretion system F family protein n=2 Tax=Candidatus Clostridium radicumherbarum TaxID=3381662 RepID=A0ABW8TVW5_9CLOT
MKNTLNSEVIIFNNFGVLEMPYCEYKVKNLDGKELKGRCWCTNKRDLTISFRNNGFFIFYYKEIKTFNLSFIKSSLSLKELVLFCNNFSSLLSAGLNILDIVQIIKEDFKNKSLIRNLEEVEQLIYEGENLSYSLNKDSKLYPNLLVNMVKVGEESGRLDKIFNMLGKYYENEKKIKDRLIKVLTYPCIVLFVSILMMLIMITTIIPMLVSTLDGISAKIPTSTKIILNISSILKENYLFIAIILFFLAAAFMNFKSLESTAIKIDKFKISNIITKNLYIKLISVRFSRTLGILLESGIQISKALTITLSVIDNKYVIKEVGNCLEEVKGGKSLSESLEKMKFFPRNFMSMTKIGEETGSLDEMLIKVSDIIEEDLFTTIDKLTTLIEPALILGLSIVIGYLLIAVLMPMMNLMNSI